MVILSKRLEYNTDNMPVIDESRAFRSPGLHDDADSYGTQESGDFGTTPADQELLDDIVQKIFAGDPTL